MAWEFPADRLFDLNYDAAGGGYYSNCRLLRADSETITVVRDSAAGTRVESQLEIAKVSAIHARMADRGPDWMSEKDRVRVKLKERHACCSEREVGAVLSLLAEEREACAKLVEWDSAVMILSGSALSDQADMADALAAAIRARGKNG